MPVYGQFIVNALGSNPVNVSSDTIKVCLLTSSYTPDQDAHDFYNDVSTYEVTGTGYTAGGAALSTKTATYNSSTNTWTFDADDTTWSSSTITARYAVVYKSTGTPATSALLAYYDFGSNQSSSGGAFTIQWNASGLVTITVS